MMLPEIIKIKQIFNNDKIDNIEDTIKKELSKINVNIKKNSNIAITVGSRGIANLNTIIKTTVDFIKEKGANPFVIPAMGSHGGATADGQKKILENYGITEKYLNIPVRSSMEVIELPQDNLKNKVYIDKIASESDGIIIINRIKPHTSFHGNHESGLMKMLVIGLGKHKGAIEIHKYGVNGLKNLILPTAKQIIKHNKILFGLALVENAYDEIMLIKALNPSEFENSEQKLLKTAKKNMPKLPANDIDILIIDQLGKNISGVGIDPNIIGRMRIQGIDEPENPKIKRIIISNLTNGSNGNAIGMGLADFITKKFYKKIDFKSTYENALTTTFIERAKIPIVMDNEKTAFLQAIRSLGNIVAEKLKIIRIKNTLKLDEVYVSKPIYDEIKDNPNIKQIDKDINIFKKNGELIKF
jgi:hypothetical protein